LTNKPRLVWLQPTSVLPSEWMTVTPVLVRQHRSHADRLKPSAGTPANKAFKFMSGWKG